MSHNDPMIHEDALPGRESALHPAPDWRPRYPGSGRLAGKCAIVTGADSGIGRAVAALYAREGADLLISYLNEQEDEDARETARQVEAAGRRCVLVPGDITSAEHCRHLVSQAVDAFGKIDILVNNAAFQQTRQSLEEISEELGDKVTIAKMDIMANTDVPGRIGVQSIPLMVLFKDGKPVAQKLGAAPKSALKGWLESEL